MTARAAAPAVSRRACCAAGWWLAVAALARAQAPPRSARVAVLGGSAGLADPNAQRVFVGPLRDGLRDAGWVEGRHPTIERRFADSRPERLPGRAVRRCRAVTRCWLSAPTCPT